MPTTRQRAREIADAIQQIKLPLVPTKLSTLAHILAQIVNKEISPEQAQQEIEKNRDLLVLVKSLEGEEFVTDRTQITFGTGNSLGDVSIRDIVGRDIINLNIHLLVASEGESLQTTHHTQPQSITHLWFQEDELQQFDYQNFLGQWLKACVVGALFSILISSILFASTMSNYSSGYYSNPI